VSQEERDLINTLAGQEAARSDCVSEGMHRWQDAARDSSRLPFVVQLVKDWVDGPAVAIDSALLRLAQRPSDVALLQRPSGSRREHEAVRIGLPHPQPVTLDQLRAGGIDFPAVVTGELELNGYAIERVYEHGRQIGVRLLETEAPDPPASRRRDRWRRASR
jgi:hypothetical protein